MRLFLKAAAAGLGLAAAVALPACQSQPAATEPVALPARPAAYVCPMKCEGSASSQPGKCPVCHMDLEPNPAAAAATPDSL